MYLKTLLERIVITPVSRFVSDDEVHFPGASLGLAGRSGAGAQAQEERRGKQGLLSCMMGCTRELRVRNTTYSVLDYYIPSRVSACPRPAGR